MNKAMRFLEKMEQTHPFKSRGIKMQLYTPLCEGNESPRYEFKLSVFDLPKFFNYSINIILAFNLEIPNLSSCLL